MNSKRFIAAVVVLFIFIICYEALVHGVLLMNLYKETHNVWRSQQQMLASQPFNFIIKALLAIWTTFIFTRFYPAGGGDKGLTFGFYIGILAGIEAAAAYYYLPITGVLAAAWFFTCFIEYLIGGWLIGAIYRR